MMKSDVTIPKEKTVSTVNTYATQTKNDTVGLVFHRPNLDRTFDPERHPVVPIALYEFPEREHVRRFDLCRIGQLSADAAGS